MKKIFIFFLLNFFVAGNLFAQKEANIWVFGNGAALDFNSGSPIPFSVDSFTSVEGCASIADSNGHLLFYTNGETVWSKNYSIMQNGNGLLGGLSSTQSCLIVPQPSHPNIYYVFTTDELENSGLYGFRYSIVNMSFNGGNGKVVLKNQLLFSPTTEKLAATKHSNGIDFWIVGHNETNDFYSYLLDSSGINNLPIISSVASIMGQGDSQTKFSRDGSKFASAGIVGIYQFDNSSGIISYTLSLGCASDCYGVEFSPNSNLLYVSGYSSPPVLYQYNLLAGSDSDIINSKIVIDTFNVTGGQLQLGPDGKIYCAQSNYPQGENFLSVINSPNSIGLSCDYQDSAVSLGESKVCYLGLPNFCASFFSNFYNEVKSVDNSNVISIYPNPFTEDFQLSITGAETDAEVSIYNIIGQQQEHLNISHSKSIRQTLSLRNYSAGVYLVSITVNGQRFMRKVVKE